THSAPPDIYPLSLHDALPISQSVADTAHFLGAGPRERHWEEKQERVFLSEIVAQFDLLGTVGCLGRESEIGRFSSNCKWHKQSSGLSLEGEIHYKKAA